MTVPAALARDLGPALHRAAADGAAHEPGVVPAPWREAVLAELEAERYVELPAVEGPHRVRQQGEHVVLHADDLATRPAMRALHRAVVDAVHRHPGIDGLARWHPDEVTIQRYAPGSAGISAHRDGRRHAYLVAILTLEGSARLRRCADREGTTVEAFDADAGSLVLLRGRGLGGIPDDRPLHAVDGPRDGRRTSFTLRATAP
ncbi:hypothetical protein [Actinomycetospora cinnamomea]|uniref:Fe2OG dioxygenase domain-containing protein n=1 Tax=Actinomycetospora cinnamomea TaxID=663609 RepID=A0A2U1EXG7_9PSEU|nr:hypothetical protein [Actinomycetospora cinnamomea]PVZ04599.1 hypothetical protein C8D89_11752 [Actinomycetospora cinnamomea]